jgi:CubicO group peptidase (beta-lactamase class C family)
MRRWTGRWAHVALPILAAAVAIACPPPRLHGQSPLGEALRPDIERILAHWGAPGVAVAVVQHGEVLLAGGYGSTRVAGGIPVDGQTLTSVASVTKPFAAVAVAILIDDGLVAWDDPVVRHIPEFRFAEPWRTGEITTRDLLAHRSGLPAVLGGFRAPEYTVERVLAELPTAQPRIAFRERLDYSQIGLTLVGEVVARAGGSSWAEFVQRRILDPLDMHSTYPGTVAFLAAYPAPAEDAPLMGRAVRRDGIIVDGPWWGVGEIYAAAAGTVTTAHDMTRFMAMLLNGGVADGSRLVGGDRIREMHAPIGIDAGPYSSVVNPLAKIVGYGLGWLVHEHAGRLITEHPGSNVGSSTMALVPEAGIGVFLSSNATYSLDSDRMISALKFTIIDHLLDLPRRDWITLLDGAP